MVYHQRLRGGGFGRNGKNTGGEGFFFLETGSAPTVGDRGVGPLDTLAMGAVHLGCRLGRGEEGGIHRKVGQGGFAKGGLATGLGCQWDGRGEGGRAQWSRPAICFWGKPYSEAERGGGNKVNAGVGSKGTLGGGVGGAAT